MSNADSWQNLHPGLAYFKSETQDCEEKYFIRGYLEIQNKIEKLIF